MSDTATLRIVAIAFDGISPFHLSVPALVFGEDRQSAGAPRFSFAVCALASGALQGKGGIGLHVARGLRVLARADIVIMPSWHDDLRPAPPALLRALQRAHARGALLVGLCLGSFVLAQAGLLDGRVATTHWVAAERFAQQYPQVRLDPDVLYVDDGDVITSAGTAAALDCCLHLMRRLGGAEPAQRVARSLVLAPHRHGGQAQFIDQPLPPPARGSRLAAVMDWALRHLDQPLTLDLLARRAAMSRRNFTRHARQAMGTTVLQWLLQQRLLLARRLLEGGDHPLERVAAKAGFGSAANLRQHFARHVGLSPQAYRQQFRGGPSALALVRRAHKHR